MLNMCGNSQTGRPIVLNLDNVATTHKKGGAAEATPPFAAGGGVRRHPTMDRF